MAHSSRTLLNAPATVTRNRVQPELDRALRVEMLTHLIALQERAFKPLGVKLESTPVEGRLKSLRAHRVSRVFLVGDAAQLGR